MSTFWQKNKYHLLTLFILILIAIISKYFLFTTHDTVEITQKDITKSFDFAEKVSKNNLNIKTSKHTNITIDKQATTSTKSEISTLDRSVSEGIDQQSEIIPITYHLSPITLVVANEEYFSEFVSNTTVYKLMQNLSASSIKPFSFSGKDYGANLGFFVNEINGLKNNSLTGEYWLYYINDQSANVGITNYIINSGDKIEWRYETTNF